MHVPPATGFFLTLILQAFFFFNGTSSWAETGTITGGVQAVRYIAAARLVTVSPSLRVLKMPSSTVQSVAIQAGDSGDIVHISMYSGIEAVLAPNASSAGTLRATAVATRLQSGIAAEQQVLFKRFSAMRPLWTEVFSGTFAKKDGQLLFVDRNTATLRVASLSGETATIRYAWQGLPLADPDDIVSAGEFSGDDLDDFVLVSPLNGKVQIFENLGNGTFKEHTIGMSADLPASRLGQIFFLNSGDSDCDGKKELLIADQTSQGILLHSYTAAKTSVRTLMPRAPNIQLKSMAIGRFDSNACMQVLLAIAAGEISEGLEPSVAVELPLYSAPLPAIGIGIAPERLVRTDRSGNFTFSNLRPGEYTVIPFGLGYTFKPGSLSVQIAGNELVYADFFVEITPPSGDTLAPCNGFNPVTLSWGDVLGDCPSGQAVMGIDDGRYSSQYPSSQTCCPLPPGILTGETLEAPSYCPEGYIALGAPRNLRITCGKIDTERYALGPPLPGRYWGVGRGGKKGYPVVNKQKLTAGLRYALGRRNQRSWDGDGCVGEPSGALLSGAEGRRCSGAKFRQLLRKSASGALEPMPLLPQCIALNDIFDPTPSCR